MAKTIPTGKGRGNLKSEIEEKNSYKNTGTTKNDVHGVMEAENLYDTKLSY